LNEYIKYGHNRDKEKLPQLNLAMLFGQKSRLPVYFHQLPGNITDVTTLMNLLKTFNFLEKKPLNYVMDKGFYSKKNIDSLIAMRQKFTVSVPISNKWVQLAIDDIHQDIHGPQGYQRIDSETLYVHTRLYRGGEMFR
jgi:transposase